MALTVFVFYLLHTSVFTTLRLSVTQPDMLAVMLACISCYTGTFGGFCAGAVSGILLDAMVGNVMGLYIVLYPLMGYGAAKMRSALNVLARKLFRKRLKAWRRLIVSMVICLLIVALRETIFVTYMFLNGVELGFSHVLRVLTCMFYSAVMILPSDWLIRRLLGVGEARARKPGANGE